MLRRQKTILGLLVNSGHTLKRTQLVKLAFLLRKQTEVGKDPTFYDFVPYKYGPFSFALYRELDALERSGYFQSDGERLAIVPQMSGGVRDLVDELPESTRFAVASVATRYKGMTHERLLRHVYERYPWYAVKSERTDLISDRAATIPTAQPAVYTVGYEGKSIDRFFNGLLKNGIQVIIDVRANPVSRKYGFARLSLERIAEYLSIEYCHHPTLGITGDRRIDLNDFASYQRLLDTYERDTLPAQAEEVRRLARKVLREPSVLLCVERDVRCCHRSRLAKALAAQSRLPIIHLR